jgi:hypothetical protein
MTKPKVPTGLNAAGKALWSQISGKYELRADELATLESACRASDRVVAMEEARAGEIMTVGSMGQAVVHPLIAEVRAHEAQIASLLAKLKLPDEAGESSSNQQRSAAQSRWAASYGKAG